MAGPIVEAIQEPFQALKSIRVTVRDATRPPILVRNAFLGGSSPDLREIKLDGIAFPFPAIRQALLSNNNLVELHLSNVPNEVYFSPDQLAELKRKFDAMMNIASGPCHPDLAHALGSVFSHVDRTVEDIEVGRFAKRRRIS